MTLVSLAELSWTHTLHPKESDVLLIDDSDINPCPRERVARHQTCGSRTNDQHIGPRTLDWAILQHDAKEMKGNLLGPRAHDGF